MPEEENVLVILPTGEGKSLLYQSMALYKPNHTIPVVVPTVSLAQDQEISLEENRKLYNINKKHAYVGGNKDVNNSILDLISSGNQGLLFSNPESFVTSLKGPLIESAKKGNIDSFFIDEAHLVYSWGIDFRSEYQALAGLINELRSVSPLGKSQK